MRSADCGVRLKQGGGKKSFGRSLREAFCPYPHGRGKEAGSLLCPYQLLMCLCLCAPFAMDRERGWRDQHWLILVCHTKSLFLPPGWAPVRKTNSINMTAGKRLASWHLALQLFRHSNSSVGLVRHCCGSGGHQSSSSYRQVWGPWLGSARTSLEWTAGECVCRSSLSRVVLIFPSYKNRGHRYFGCH